MTCPLNCICNLCLETKSTDKLIDAYHKIRKQYDIREAEWQTQDHAREKRREEKRILSQDDMTRLDKELNRRDKCNRKEILSETILRAQRELAALSEASYMI